jgi:NAD(P)-dependent dehydrogenase (short-subunit alcohol dehydrogenase family)
MSLLEGRSALVTGGARGNGAGIARGLAEHGASVVVADIDGAAAEAQASELEAQTGVRAVGHAGDVGDAADVGKIVERVVAEFGRLDVVVNNAGVLHTGHFLAITMDDWEATLRVNLTGPMLVSQAAARVMAASAGGSIINVTSIATDTAFHGTGSYCASKGGLQSLTRVMAMDLADDGIRVNTVAPGFIKTPMTEPLYTTPDAVATLETYIPQARMGLPADLVGTIVFLASDLSRYVTGTAITVDGGVTAGLASWRSS